MADEPLTCEELVGMVTEYVENALGPPDRARSDVQVAAWGGCQIDVREMRTTLELVRAIAASRRRDGL